MSIWTIVLAAGTGARFGGPKQFEVLGDRRLVDWTTATAREVSDGVVVVVPEGHDWQGDAVDAVVTGGADHGASVRAGLEALPESTSVVIVATAVHPLASARLFRAVAGAVDDGADAAVPAVESADALKRVDGSRIVGSVAKADIRIVQAPSAFRPSVLRDALAVGDAPEELELVERAGGCVAVVAGEATNIHIARPADMAVANAIVAAGLV